MCSARRILSILFLLAACSDPAATTDNDDTGHGEDTKTGGADSAAAPGTGNDDDSALDSNDTNGGDPDDDTTTAGDTDTGPRLLPFKGVANSPTAEIAELGASWCYNWMAWPVVNDCGDPLFVPMIWGASNVGSMAAIAAAGYDVVLGFNEPNKRDQANMSVEEALDLWPLLTEYPDIRVGSPSVSDDGRAWLNAFMDGVTERGLRVDFITMHWYGWNTGSCDNANQLEGALNWATEFGRPVWITEFGCMHQSNPDAATVENFFAAALEMFDRKPMLERYAWYPWNPHNHLYQDGSQTPLGFLFAETPANR